MYFLEHNEVKLWDKLPTGRVLALAVFQKRVWVLTVRGLFQIFDNSCSKIDVPEELSTIRAIAAGTSDAYLWVGTDQLLARVEINNHSQVHWYLELLSSHPDDKLSNLGRCALFLPNSEQVCVGTAGGLFTYKLNKDQEWELLNDQDIRTLASTQADPKSLWMLTWLGGVEKLPLDGLLSDNALQLLNLQLLLAVGQDGYLYSLLEQALWSLSKNNTAEIFPLLPPHVYCLQQTPNGIWWLGTTEGLYRLVNSKWESVSQQSGLLATPVYAMVVVKNTLCLAAENGLWTLQDNNWEQHKSTLSSSRVWALAPSLRSDALWLACEDGVINYNPFTRSRNEPYDCINCGLASRRVTALVECPQSLWIITQVGISRVTLD